MNNIIHLEPYQYAHIKDKIENIIFLIEGPNTYVLKSYEQIVQANTDMIKLVPNSYVRVKNPVIKDEDGKVVFENLNGKLSKLAKLKFGDEETRNYSNNSDPFPLYPGESLVGTIKQARILNEFQALRLVSVRKYKDEYFNVDREVGEEWVLPGPLIYFDHVEVEVTEDIQASVITYNKALRVMAKRDFTDRNDIKRISGEEWIIKKLGPYIPSAEEIVIDYTTPYYLSDTSALILRSTSNFTDAYGIKRNVGDTWLLTNEITSIHIPDVYEVLVKQVEKIVLNRWQYCLIRNPYKDGKSNFGAKEIRKGETSFFLQPDEELVNNVQNMEILSKDEALLVMANENFEDELGSHISGERWLVQGPRSYIPSVEVTILDRRNRIFLSENEGIYVRDIHSGSVKMVSNTSYILEAHEELWEKELPVDVQLLLQANGTYHVNSPPVLRKDFDFSKVITFTVPHNSVTQVFDYKSKKNKLVFGPALIKLEPHEQFTVLEFSGDNPKQEKKIKSLLMRLGPDFLSDTVEVETSDHAKLLLKLTYSWQFIFDKNNEEDLEKLFQVKDFVGDCTKSIASRIRGIVSSVSFDSFHKESSSIVQIGVFGKDSSGNLKKPLFFKSNNLYISNVDIQSQEPVDKKTRDILNESMKLSMSTNIKIQEADARHRENRANQEAKGKVERKKFEDETQIEEKRLILLELEAQLKKEKLIGQYESVAKAEAEEKEISSSSELQKAKNKFEAEKILQMAEIERQKEIFNANISHLKLLSELEIQKAKESAESEILKIEKMVKAIGKETLVEIARAGPESQAKILGSLGVKSMLITDGKNPINLFNTGNGLMGALGNN